jgi:hypothetical protein
MRQGFEFQRLTEDMKMAPVRREDELPLLVQAHHDSHGNDKWTVAFNVCHPKLPNLNASFDYNQFTRKQSRLLIGALIDFEFGDDRAYIAPFENLLLEVVSPVRDLVKSEYACIDNANRNATSPKDGEKRRLVAIGWVNLWGPEWVETYGRKTLLGMPGIETRELPDGGVFHRLCDRLTTPDKKEGTELRQRVAKYCADHGLKAKCYAPYSLAAARPEPKVEYDLEQHLATILATTLVLTDGTRLKPIVIDWNDLTPEQRDLALEMIQVVATAELKRLARGKRLRLEFNHVPDELERMLRGLAPPDEDRLEWAVVRTLQ